MMKIRKSLAISKQYRKASGYIERLQSSSVIPDDEFFYIEPDEYLNIKNEYPDLPSEPVNSMTTNSVAISKTGMVGTELKKLIDYMPIPKKACYRCKSLEAKMNKWGPDKCLEKIDYICDKLWVSARRRKIPYIRTVVVMLVKKAINNARNN